MLTTSRLAFLGVIGIIGGCAIILIAVALTPMEDLPIEPADQGSVSAVDGQGNSGLAGAAAESGTRFSSPSASRGGYTPSDSAASSPRYVPPTVAEEIDVEQLQAELRELATAVAENFSDDPLAVHLAAQIHFDLKDTQQAEELWEESLQLSPDFSEPYRGLGELHVSRGEDERAVEVLAPALPKLKQTTPAAYNTLGTAYENLGQLEEARIVLLQATDRFPDYADNWLILGRVHSQLENFEQAEASLQRVIELQGPSEQVLVALVSCYLKQGNREQALEVRTQLADLQTQRRTEASREASSDRVQEATSTANASDSSSASTASDDPFQEDYEQALRAIATDHLRNAALIYKKHADDESAMAWLKRSLQIDPTNSETCIALAALFYELRQIDTVEGLYRRLIELQPNNLVNYMNLASVLLAQGRPQDAEAMLKRVIAKDPKGYAGQAALARLYLAFGNIAEARMLALQVLERRPAVDSYLLLASTYQAAGDIKAAKAAVEKARTINPDDPMISKFELSIP